MVAIIKRLIIEFRSIIEPILPARTRGKVKILGSNWREEILEFANPEVLPTFWNVPGEKEVV